MAIVKTVKNILKLFCYFLSSCVLLSWFFMNSQIKLKESRSISQKNIKYILIWGSPDEMWNILDIKRKAFTKNDCEFKNCHITYNENLFINTNKKFTAVLINGKTLALNNTVNLPDRKKIRYSYSVFVIKESATVHPVCDTVYDNYFNLTWTYKLDSDVVWKPFIIYDKGDNEIGPKINTIWNGNIYLKNYSYSDIVMRKKMTAAWFASECVTQSKRERFFEKVEHELKFYGLDVQVVGSCGSRECPEGEAECEELLNKFYFYFAYENSIAEDYVSGELLKPLLHYAVPVVFGGANYSRFLPPKSYINSKLLGPRKTAHTMYNLIKNKDEYTQYLKWNDHYYYSTKNKQMCDLCELLNRDQIKVYKDFRLWWNSNYKKDCDRGPQKQSMLYPSYDFFFKRK